MSGWDFSCPDWEERLRAGRSLVPDLPLDRVAAERAIAVYNQLCLPDVIGKPTLGEAGGDWFRDIVRALMGSVHGGKRMIREAGVLVPKKNSKTTNGGALIMTAALLSPAPRAEFFFLGPTQAIADTGFNQALGMVLADPDLEKRVKIQEHLKRITIVSTGVRLMISTFDQHILTGRKMSGGTLIDELHLLGELAKAEEVMRQIRGGMVPYPLSFLMWISTQSEKPPAGVFKAELMKARAVRDGRLKAPMLPVLYELPERMLKNDDWRRREFWHLVNPNLGRSVTLDAIQELYDDAVAKGEGQLRGFASQHLNVEIGVALRSDQWEGAEFWAPQVDKSLTLKEIIRRSDVCVVGIDGGGLDDLLGLCIMGRDRVTRDWLAFFKAWAHESVLERRKEIAPRLKDFVAARELEIFSTPGDDVAALVALVMEVKDADLLPQKHGVGVDIIAISEIVDELALNDITVESEMIVGITQGWKMANTIKTFARRLAAGTFWHAGTGLMDWVIGNAKVEPKGNAVMITKQIAGTGKIDPLMAGFNAVALMAKNPSAGGETSVYEEMAAAASSGRPGKSDEIERYAAARQTYSQRFLAGDSD